MDHLTLLIKGLNKEQVRFYKLFAGRTEHGNDRKDITLFDTLRKQKEDVDDSIIQNKLYPGSDKNAWYRLRNRLLSDLNKALTVMQYEEDNFIQTCNMLGLYRNFSTRNQLQEAKYYLRRAERSAKSMENFGLLDIIYGEYIRLSYESLNIDPEIYIEMRRQNRKQQEELRAIDDLLAVVTYRLKTTQNFSTDKNPLLDLLKTSTDDFIKDRDLKNSPLLRFRIYQAVVQVLLQRHEYRSMEPYLLKTFKEFERDKLFNRNNHDTKLQLLTYIVNTLFKNNKLKQSLQWAERLKLAMAEYHQMLQDKYLFFYYNALVINYSILDRLKAIEILEDLKENPKIKSNSYYHLFVYLNLAVLRFDVKEYKESIKNFTRLYMLDGYKTADRSLRFKISICELITRFELHQYDVLEYKTAQVKKDYKDLLAEERHYTERELLAIMKTLPDNLPLRKHPIMLKKARELVDWMRKNNDTDSVIINYELWLEEKLKG